MNKGLGGDAEAFCVSDVHFSSEGSALRRSGRGTKGNRGGEVGRFTAWSLVAAVVPDLRVFASKNTAPRSKPSMKADTAVGSKRGAQPARLMGSGFLDPLSHGVLVVPPMRDRQPQSKMRKSGLLKGHLMKSKLFLVAIRSLGVLLTAMALYAPATSMAACKPGWEVREAYPNDPVCVSPDTRRQVRADNAAAASRVQPGGGSYGPNTCKQGWVWREARTRDLVCVDPRQRAQAKADNQAAASRSVPTSSVPPTKGEPVIATGKDGRPVPPGSLALAQCKVGGAKCPLRMAPLYDEASLECLCR